jgi:hypothetical protein
VRHPAHRRARLARAHALQGRLPRQPPRRAVVLAGTALSLQLFKSIIITLLMPLLLENRPYELHWATTHYVV